ncbi:MAG: apiosidase-like domain-containing protein [Armatimonadota bacterium]
MNAITQNMVAEWSFKSCRRYTDPFNDITLDVVFVSDNGEITVPAFWAGDGIWRVRFSSFETGCYTYRTVCSDETNSELHNVQGEFEVTPYKGDNPLYTHGPIETAPDGRHFQHKDGTPFLWLADTWWMGFTTRLSWPKQFQNLVLDRAEKGFSVVQIVAGLYPDMPPFYPGGANEAGFPWTEEYGQINPEYFDYVDRRINYLIDTGIVPCIFGCWGYFSKFMGVEKLKDHWRYLVARYAAYPVVWSLAGEGVLPYYTDPLWGQWDKYTPGAKADWTEIARYVHSIEPYGRLMSIHPPCYGSTELCGHNMLEDRSLVDFDMLQTVHGSMNNGYHSVMNVRYARSLEPAMPVLQSEGFYEGILEQGREETQRWFFWSSILSGTAGHTYGANGIWQLNTKEEPFRGNPINSNWGDTPWDVAAQLPGGKQVGIGKKILEGYDWWLLEPHQEWVPAVPSPHSWVPEAYASAMQPYAAGIPGKLRMIYTVLNDAYIGLAAVHQMELGVVYSATYINPSSGQRHEIGDICGDANGRWIPTQPPSNRDWLIVMVAKG